MTEVLDRLGRFAPLTGVVFVVLMVVNIFVSSSTPSSTAQPLKVISFYTANGSSQKASDLLVALAFVFFVFFVAALYGYLRQAPSAGVMPLVSLGGALMFAVGSTIFAGIDFALADAPAKLTPGAAQALNLLDNDLVFPLSIGAITFGVATGLAIVRSDLLPAWLGWAVLVLGILAGTPAFIVGIIGLLVWTLVVSVLIYQRTGGRATGEPMMMTPTPA